MTIIKTPHLSFFEIFFMTLSLWTFSYLQGNAAKSVTFVFDRVYNGNTTTAEMYNEIPYSLTQSFLEGWVQSSAGPDLTYLLDPDPLLTHPELPGGVSPEFCRPRSWSELNYHWALDTNTGLDWNWSLSKFTRKLVTLVHEILLYIFYLVFKFCLFGFISIFCKYWEHSNFCCKFLSLCWIRMQDSQQRCLYTHTAY